MRLLRRVLAVVFLVLGAAPLWSGVVLAQTASQRDAYVVRLEGVVTPVTARHVVRHLRTAEERGAEVFILTMDTPGGLDTSMREIVQALLNAKTPTVVFVSPKGARAASAGAFITAAAHVAAMAPGTNIGAATPVALGAELPATLERKATNDAAAYIREIALLRGRNADWLESTVRSAASAPATEALKMRVIDLIAEDLPDLLQKLDGRSVTIDGAARSLRTADAGVTSRGMTLLERLLGFVADPTIATLFISLGSLAIISEFFHPSLVMGLTGGILLALGLVGVGNLPVNWAALALILVGAALLLLELLTSGWGVFGFGSLACFVVGMLLLFSTYQPSLPGAPDFRASSWAIAGTSAFIALVIFFLVVVVLRSSKIVPLPQESLRLVGQTGVVTSDLAPRGTVQLRGELWTAEAESGVIIGAGERVEAVAVEGLVLRVRKVVPKG